MQEYCHKAGYRRGKTSNHSSDNKKRLPSIIEQDSLANDEKLKMVSSFEIKSHREREHNNSFSQGKLNFEYRFNKIAMPKASSKEERTRRKDSGKLLEVFF